MKLDALISWIGIPLYVWQGLAVRRNSVRQGPPIPQKVAAAKGAGEPLRILLVGDSSAAGVGTKDINLSLGGQLVQHICARSGRPVEIRIVGCNSATSGQIRDYVLPHIEFAPYTHVILNIGINDAKNFHTQGRFYREFGTLLYGLNTRFPDARIIWSGVLDMATVPALPSPLNKILGIRSRLLMRCGRTLCAERMAEIPDGEWDPSAENFSDDGFHASAKGYRQWAQILAEYLLKKQAPFDTF